MELVPNGRGLPVTAVTKNAYVKVMTHYLLNARFRPMVRALLDGLHDILDLSLLRLFNQRELQTLISGTSAPVDLADLRAHTVYHLPYSDDHPTIQMFWHVVESLSQEQLSKLLRFVTSCSRPPLLGFKELQPAFAIHNGMARSPFLRRIQQMDH